VEERPLRAASPPLKTNRGFSPCVTLWLNIFAAKNLFQAPLRIPFIQ
jgi:hypothetical protein